MSETVRVQLLRAGAKLPFRASETASGFDVYACLDGGSVPLGARPTLVPTGIALEIPPGLDVQLRPRSGLGARGVITTFGTIDADFRGELRVNMYTMSDAIEHTVYDGDRIGQLVVSRLADVAFEQALVLSETRRGNGGHGSTGR
ncbi:MAG TPA: dUTP diphosphatase [Tepidiformaceae bacterium]|nr:dUTP diphosphatase [Tepidiformaceae bacterium]